MIKLKVLFSGFVLSVVCLASNASAQYPSFADLAEKLMPSVVNISSFTAPENTDTSSANAETSESLGSGFIIDKDGYIITNNHVVDKADSIQVTLFDNQRLEAKLIGKDPKTDLALIKIDAKTQLQPVTFGDSDKIRVGDWILAIGNPFGLGGSVTAGIVSAKSRDIESGPYDNFIQTDAAINQGNSGGPMFNMSGEVIGISSAIFSTTGASQGIGFAIPVNLADWVITQLKKFGTVKRGWIGIKIQPNSQEIASNLGISQNQGVVVSGFTPNGPAQKAGFVAGDIILSFNGEDIDNTKNLSRMIAETPIGTLTSFEVWRNQKKIKLNAKIEQMPEEEPAQTSSSETIEENTDLPPIANEAETTSLNIAGIKVKDLTPEVLSALKANINGVVVEDVLPNSDAAHKGVKIGDIIVKVDQRNVLNAQMFDEFVSDAYRENKRPILLAIQGVDALHFVAVKLVKND